METLHEIDAMTLQQALAETSTCEIDLASFLDDIESLLEGQAMASTDISQLQQQSAPPHRRKRHETERRREIHALRAQVASLEQTLRLEASRVQQAGTITAVGEVAALKRECEEIVVRQYCSRIAAQIRNLQLRRIYDDHRRDAHQIQRLGQRLVTLQKSVPRRLDTPTMHIFTMTRVDPCVQMQRLPGLKREADMMFQSTTFRERECDRVAFSECNRGSESNASLEMVFEATWVLPFAVKDVADALWMQTTRVLTASNQVQWLDIHVDTTSLVSQFLVTPTDGIAESVKCGQVATHRECSPEGQVQLVTNVQLTDIENGVCTKVFSSDVWSRVEPISTSGGSPLSQVLWCRRLRLQPPALQSHSASERRRWIENAVFGPVRAREAAMLKRNRQSMENLLLARSVSKATS